MSAYELTGQKEQYLVEKAKQLADSLSVAWTQVGTVAFRRDSTQFQYFQGNDIPWGYVNFNTSSPVEANVKLTLLSCQNTDGFRAVKHR